MLAAPKKRNNLGQIESCRDEELSFRTRTISGVVHAETSCFSVGQTPNLKRYRGTAIAAMSRLLSLLSYPVHSWVNLK